jgi:hypothetical protein
MMWYSIYVDGWSWSRTGNLMFLSWGGLVLGIWAIWAFSDSKPIVDPAVAARLRKGVGAPGRVRETKRQVA